MNDLRTLSSINHRKRKSNHSITIINNSVNDDTIDNDNNNSMMSSTCIENDTTTIIQQQPPQEQQLPSLSFLPLRQLRLEAIFYPKFENEQTTTSSTTYKASLHRSSSPPTRSSIREQMIERCVSKSHNNTEDGNGHDHTSSSNAGPTIFHHHHHSGYIEVSIKHSGSLVLWSGDTRYYSKNSTHNVFTDTCELLLRQHFYQYCLSTMPHQSQSSPKSWDNTFMVETVRTKAKDLYNTCSKYIVQHRLTLSFEVVTSVLGDHGARPIHDYILLTAIADRNRITPHHHHDENQHMFYTTIEIIEFAQKFHLPHNDYWIYNNAVSIQQLFHLYDTSRETGVTSTILPALTKAAMYNHHHVDITTTSVDRNHTDISECDYYIQSMYPHDVYQGEILEGIVIRYVQHQAPLPSSVVETDSSVTAAKDGIAQIIQLSRNSKKIVQQFTSTTNSVWTKRASSDTGHEHPSTSLFDTNLRTLYDETKALYSKKGSELFEVRLRNILQESSEQQDRRTVIQRMANDPSSSLSMSKQLPIWIESLLQKHHSEDRNSINYMSHPTPNLDIETYQIAKLIKDLTLISKNVTYTIFEEKKSNHTENDDMTSTHIPRYICIVHVLHDQTFHKYHRHKNKVDLPLFRGFSFELIGGDEHDVAILNNDNGTKMNDQPIDMNDLHVHDHTMHVESGTLMLKMKFLPYMVRTFCCRNGLKVIRQADGITAFVNFTNNLMSKWGISDDAKLKWRPYFAGWAHYAQPLLRSAGSNQQSNDVKEADLPPLSEYAYLHHLQKFTDLYNSGQYKVMECRSQFQGLAVIVAPNIEVSGKMADYVAQRLGGAHRRTGLNDVTPSIMEVACTPGHGIVCNVVIDRGYTTIRKHLLKDFEEFVSIVLVQCSDVMTEPQDSANKELIGILKGWKATRGARNIEIPDRINTDTQLLADDTSFQPSDILDELISQLTLPIVEDSRPGLLIFFPTIPGSGKSSLVTSIDKDIHDAVSSCNRKIQIDESDRYKGKFWPHITKTRRRCYSAINIADKNAPTSAWGAVGTICASTKALAVPVLPDRFAFQTNSVVGVRRKDGTIDNALLHTYPFSLPYLAVCMTRVLLRPAGSHAGQLDQSNDRLCMIVIKFYSFYRNLSTEQLLASMTATLGSAGAHVTPAPIEVPFFGTNREKINLPQDVEYVLLEALRCQFGYEKDKVDTTSSKEKDADEYLDDLELRLRSTLVLHQDVILHMTADLPDTRRQFVHSIVDKINEVDTMSTSYDAPPVMIHLAAIDIDRKSVYDVLQDLQFQHNDTLSRVFEQILQDHSWESILQDESDDDPTLATKLGFVTKTHITLAHYRDTSQANLQLLYTPYLESSVELTTNAIYYNERIMALSIKNNQRSEIMTSDGSTLPPSASSSQSGQNHESNRDFVHITIWCSTGVSAFEANTLPTLVKENKAHCIEFPEQVLQGSISFWYM